METCKCLVGGEWVEGEGQRDIFDPGTGELLAVVPEFSPEDTKVAISVARRSFDSGDWRKLSGQDRGKVLLQIAHGIRAKAQELAELETKNCGKPLAEAEFDIQDAANCFEFYAGLASKIHGETMSVPANSFSFVLREPVGVCAQIIPWNFPLLMAAWKIAPAIAAGNSLVLKPSELTPLSALQLGEIISKTDLPQGVVNIVTGSGSSAGHELSINPLVDKVAFTGGTATGRKVMANAAHGIKKVSLELGGKNPNIVFADADFAAAVDGALFAAFANQGEVCSAGSRLLLERKIYDEFIEALVLKASNIKVGYGLERSTKMGALISSAHLAKVMDYIELGKKEGAKIVFGGKRPNAVPQKGHYLEPTIFADVTANMTIAREEIFGPVLAVIPFDSYEEALQIANDTDYGLAAGVWTKDVNKALNMIRDLRVGISWVNTYHPTYNEMPWGGYKQSGIGRELGLHGIEAYLETKQVNINLDTAPLGWY